MRELFLAQLIRPGVEKHGLIYEAFVNSLIEPVEKNNIGFGRWSNGGVCGSIMDYRIGLSMIEGDLVNSRGLDVTDIPSLISFLEDQMRLYDDDNLIVQTIPPSESPCRTATLATAVSQLLPRRNKMNVATSVTSRKLCITLLRGFLSSGDTRIGRCNIDVRPVLCFGGGRETKFVDGAVVLDVFG